MGRGTAKTGNPLYDHFRRQDLVVYAPTEIPVLMHVHSDDFVIEWEETDISGYLERLTVDQPGRDELRELVEANWGGDYAADRIVADLQAQGDADALRLEDYIVDEKDGKIGFEARIDPEAAERWLKELHPTLHKLLCG